MSCHCFPFWISARYFDTYRASKLLKRTLTLKPFNVSYCAYSSTILCLIMNHCNILNSSSSVTQIISLRVSCRTSLCWAAVICSVSLRQLHWAAVIAVSVYHSGFRCNTNSLRSFCTTADGKLERWKEERNSPDSIRKSFNLASCCIWGNFINLL